MQAKALPHCVPFESSLLKNQPFRTIDRCLFERIRFKARIENLEHDTSKRPNVCFYVENKSIESANSHPFPVQFADINILCLQLRSQNRCLAVKQAFRTMWGRTSTVTAPVADSGAHRTRYVNAVGEDMDEKAKAQDSL